LEEKLMNILINVLSIVYVLCCILIVVLVLLQKSEQGGASESIMGTTANNFYEKNKGRTREGKLKRSTILFSVVFVVLTIVLTILNMVVA